LKIKVYYFYKKIIMTDCPICCAQVDRETPMMSCRSCEDQCCLVCFQKNILVEENEPQCLFCRKPILMEYILEMTPRVWVREQLMPHLCRLRIQQEYNLLVDDQEEACKILKIRKLRDEISRLPLLRRIRQLYKKKPDELAQQELAVKQKKTALREQIRDLEGEPGARPKNSKRGVFNGFCPRSKCQGFLGQDFVCMLCDEPSCSDCGESRPDDHQCDPQIRLNFRAVRTESKPCPQCGVPIFQTSGCDQMWCVQCCTPFSWVTGKKIDGVIHNPHYYEWLASIPNNNEAGPHPLDCEEFPTAERFYRFLMEHHHMVSNPQVYLSLHRMVTHLREVVFPRVRQDRVPSNQDLRIQFLVGDIDKERWARLLQHREQRRMKLNALYLLTDLGIQLFSDVIARLIRDPKNPYSLDYIAEMIKYIQTSLDRVCRLYGGTIPEGWKSVMENIPLELRMRG